MIKVFTTKTCAYCPSVKKYLSMKGKKYQEIDVTEDLNLIKPASKVSGLYTVPQVMFENGKVVVGLNYAALADNL